MTQTRRVRTLFAIIHLAAQYKISSVSGRKMKRKIKKLKKLKRGKYTSRS